MVAETHSKISAEPQSQAHSIPRSHQTILAICSDLDETPDAETYFELMRFLNTTEDTSMGPGVGLEVGNTIYFDMAPGQFSYWNASEENREKIRALIRSGHIDCLHSFGDLATTRAHAARALEELARHDCQLRVWIDHAQAATNFGADIMEGHGDEAGHAAYHADLTRAYGIKYFWTGRVTSVIGQNRPVSLSGIADWAHPVASTKTIAKEALKQVLARFGNQKYAMHGANKILADGKFRDGEPATYFLRCSPHWRGVSGLDTGAGIAEVLSTKFLDRLTQRQGACILYTHLGKLPRHSPRKFPAETVAAFRRLAEYHRSGRIHVTTTRRLLDHCSGREPLDSSIVPLQFPDLN